jgi:hypothetical protein
MISNLLLTFIKNNKNFATVWVIIILLMTLVLYMSSLGMFHAMGFTLETMKLSQAFQIIDFSTLVFSMAILSVMLVTFFFSGNLINLLDGSSKPFDYKEFLKRFDKDLIKQINAGNGKNVTKFRSNKTPARKINKYTIKLQLLHIRFIKFVFRFERKHFAAETLLRIIVFVAGTSILLIYMLDIKEEVSNLIKIDDNQYFWMDSFMSLRSVLIGFGYLTIFSCISVVLKKFHHFFVGYIIMLSIIYLSVGSWSVGFKWVFSSIYNTQDKSKIYNHIICFKNDNKCDKKANARIMREFSSELVVYIDERFRVIKDSDIIEYPAQMEIKNFKKE